MGDYKLPEVSKLEYRVLILFTSIGAATVITGIGYLIHLALKWLYG